MDPERWEIVQQIFWEARSLAGEERERLLIARCGEDVELLDEVRSLLNADAGDGPNVLDASLPGFTPLRAALPAAPTAGSDDPVPTHVGPYVVSAELGRGGMGVVYRAFDPRLGRDVALKFLPVWMLRDPWAEARFIAEARAASALDHPNNVTIYDVGTAEDGRRYIAMAYYSGGSLATRLAAGPLPLTAAVGIALQVAGALDAAHQAGIVHRDIKPANIAFGTGGQAKVLDYGVATLGDDGSFVGGTLAYMAPEQLRGSEADRRIDVWALGVVLYEMLTGRRPFRGPDDDTLRRAVLEAEPEPLTAVRPDAPPRIAGVLTRALAKDPADRFATAAELALALRGAAGIEHGVHPSEWPANLSRHPRPAGRVLRLTALGVAALAGIALAWWSWTSLRRDPAASGLDRQAVAVLPFRVRGAPSLAYLRDGMVDLLSAKLTGEGGLHATDPRAVYSAWRRRVDSEHDDLPQEGAVALARELGAGHVLIGDVVGNAQGLALNASLLDLRGTVAGRASAQGGHEALHELVDRLVGELLSTSAGEESQRVATLTSTSLAALRAYLEGQSAYRRGRYDEALLEFSRAVDRDSTFALAGLGLVLAGGWVGGAEEARERGRDVAWRNRQRVSQRDRALLTAIVGPDYPEPPTARALFRATEQALELSPASVELWHRLGDLFLHYGRFLTSGAWEPRAIEALRRAVAIDSTLAPTLHHLLMAYARVSDTAALRRVALHHLAQDSTAPSAEYVRWRASLALSDARFPPVMLDALSTEALGWIAITAQDDGAAVDQGLRAVAMRSARAGTRDERFEWLLGRYSYALNGGLRSEAQSIIESLREVQPDPGFHLRLAVLGALYGDGDTASATRAAAELATRSRAGALDACVLTQWRSWQSLGATGGTPSGELVSAATARGSALSLGADGSPGADAPSVRLVLCSAVLEALRATGAPSDPVPEAVWRLDSLLADGPVTGPIADGHSEYAHLALARLLARSGERAAALAAVRRRLYFLGWQPYLAVALREEGQLAESLGDRTGALMAYEHHLALRPDPEPPLRAAHDRVQRRVLELRRAAVDR